MSADENAARFQPLDRQPEPLVLARVFQAPRALVYRAWTATEHVRQWFCPAGYGVAQARVEARVGGPFEVCMRSPAGEEHWMRGVFLELVPERRLVFDGEVPGGGAPPLFRFVTEVDFADAAGGTRVDIVQRYTLFDERARPMVGGAPQGWGQTLDHLARELERARAAQPAQRSAAHGSFRIERRYEAPRARVWRALTEVQAKAQWFTGGSGYTVLAREMDVRPGGRERLRGRWDSGLVTDFEAHYHDVVPEERLVYSYVMHLDERKISVSLATFELRSAGAATELVLTEQGAFLDGYDDAGSRERGSNFLLDALGKSLAA